uniref:Uncharacterized protein n=1 Tax=Marseillevirus LCMAC201 TaxID=2506605 RepID=A0A481YYN6_9VIRU|nr:MAG: hypothetical protein LCMAC201_04890 [Marseillevirus LCMAC201]
MDILEYRCSKPHRDIDWNKVQLMRVPITKEKCEFYSGVKGRCRFCQLCLSQHQQYLAYDQYAIKIQKQWRFKLTRRRRQFCREIELKAKEMHRKRYGDRFFKISDSDDD